MFLVPKNGLDHSPLCRIHPIMPRHKKPDFEARTVRLNLRFTPTEWHAMAPLVAGSGLAPTTYCQRLVLKPASRAARYSIPLADTALILALNRIGTNLNQIARRLNSGSGLNPRELADTLARLNTYLDEVQR